MAGHQAERAREHIGDAIYALAEMRVGQRFRGRDQAWAVAPTRGDPAVEQFGDAIHPIGIFQLRQLEEEIGPLSARRQVVARKGVEMRGHGCRSSVEHILMALFSIAPPHASPAGLTRGSIFFARGFAKEMDCRVKPGNDDWSKPTENAPAIISLRREGR